MLALKRLIPCVLFVTMTTSIARAAPLIVAHRGASHDAPENTLPAFELAWQQGADAIEGDFRLTKDGEIICLHDADTKRVSGVEKKVAASTLAELRELDAGAWFQPQWKGTRIPTFAEVAATVPAGKKIYIELKSGPEIVPVMLEELAAAKLQPEQVVVISFHAAAIHALKTKAPQLKACWLSSFKKDGPLVPSADKALATVNECLANGFSSSADVRIDAAFAQAILGAGREYHVWTVDDPAVARRFAALGAMSITTNRPAMIREALAGGGPGVR